jgi:hypothetical protein
MTDPVLTFEVRDSVVAFVRPNGSGKPTSDRRMTTLSEVGLIEPVPMCLFVEAYLPALLLETA